MKIYCFHPDTPSSHCVCRVLFILFDMCMVPYDPASFARDFDRLIDKVTGSEASRVLIVFDCKSPQEMTSSRLWMLYATLVNYNLHLPPPVIFAPNMPDYFTSKPLTICTYFDSIRTLISNLQNCSLITEEEIESILNSYTDMSINKYVLIKDTKTMENRFRKILYNYLTTNQTDRSFDSIDLLYRFSWLPNDMLRRWQYALHQVRKGFQQVIIEQEGINNNSILYDVSISKYFDIWIRSSHTMKSSDQQIEIFRKQVDCAVDLARVGAFNSSNTDPLLSIIMDLERCIHT